MAIMIRGPISTYMTALAERAWEMRIDLTEYERWGLCCTVYILIEMVVEARLRYAIERRLSRVQDLATPGWVKYSHYGTEMTLSNERQIESLKQLIASKADGTSGNSG